MATVTPCDRAIQRVSRLCADGLDSQLSRLEVLRELRTAFSFDAYVWVLTDPVTCVGAAPLADVPCLPELPTLIRLKYLTTLNRWTALRSNEVACLHRSAHGVLSRSLIWRELLAHYAVSDIASVVLRDRFGCWGFVDFWRIGVNRQPFSAAEVRPLGALAAELTAALRRVQANTFTTRQQNVQRHTGAAVLLLDPNLTVKAQTPETWEYLTTLLPRADGPPVPAIAYNVAAQLVAVEQGVDDHPPMTRVHVGGGRWLTLRAARIDAPAPTPGGDIAVTIEESAPSDRLTVFSAAYGLTRREVEVLELLGAGHGSREIATRLFVSEHTVHDHVKSMLAKTRTRSRAALVSIALAS